MDCKSVGAQIKQYRRGKGITLKEVSEKTGLSIGYLSQMERGLTTMAYHTINKVAKALDVDISYFVDKAQNAGKTVIRHYNKQVSSIDNGCYLFYTMSDIAEKSDFLPRYVEILPHREDLQIELDPHDGQEFIYVLEGVLTLQFEDDYYDMVPGDCAHFDSTRPHSWLNHTSSITRFLVINSPNIFKEKKAGGTGND